MMIRVKSERGSIQNLSLDEVNRLLRRGKLSGREFAWMPGYLDWKRLYQVDGVQLLQGVRGWLLLFCLFIAVLQPMWMGTILLRTWHVARLGFFVDPAVKLAAFLEHGWFGLVMVSGVVVGVTIWRGHAGGRDLAVQYLRLRLGGFLLCTLLVRWIIGDAAPDVQRQIVLASLGQLTRELLVFAVWRLYFRLSVRVQNTYDER